MSTPSPEQTVQVLITGHVQGVGFRFGMQRAAELRGARGWVRNRPDGAVEAVVQGTPDAVSSVLEWARLGPRGARVERVDATPVETNEHYSGFQIRG